MIYQVCKVFKDSKEQRESWVYQVSLVHKEFKVFIYQYSTVISKNLFKIHTVKNLSDFDSYILMRLFVFIFWWIGPPGLIGPVGLKGNLGPFGMPGIDGTPGRDGEKGDRGFGGGFEWKKR